MRKISATYIFPGNQSPLKNGILFCEDDGTVIDLIDTGGQFREQAGIEHYSGILVPGFVNAHCHLELSHLKGKIPEKTGLGGFLGAINKLRNLEVENQEAEMNKADFQMKHAGIVAVGDVSNSYASLETKRNSKIKYHSFVEAFGFHPSRAERAYLYAEFVESMFRGFDLPASVTPHSPYSVSEKLFLKIRKKALAEDTILSVHNQESWDELAFFKDGSGGIARHIHEILGIDISHWQPTGKSSLEFTLSFIPKENPLLLVHNTFTSSEDIQLLKQQRHLENTFLVLCPNANLYIENRLPPVSLFQKEKMNICLGTDSLASNHALSVLQEMITLQHNFPEISLRDLVEWGCWNGAQALGLTGLFGSLDPGKKPGVNLITGVDLQRLKLTGKSKVKRLM
ncbi:MAG TPA: amidohydrolase [Mariniphaga anaerophila]|uniref:Amidohydrolase n=1 Tax=Mariniphaga anaerophila TaxID=1484053 RepID=A0A831LCC6_9BACT|nr:amidohydrolase [Mariniphaga anaerophila]